MLSRIAVAVGVVVVLALGSCSRTLALRLPADTPLELKTFVVTGVEAQPRPKHCSGRQPSISAWRSGLPVTSLVGRSRSPLRRVRESSCTLLASRCTSWPTLYLRRQTRTSFRRKSGMRIMLSSKQRLASNQAMQLTASKPAVYALGVCRRERMLRFMHRGLAAADLVAR